MPEEGGESPAAALDRVLILAPYRKDADFVGMLLDKHDIPYEACRDLSCLDAALQDPPGVLVATQESLEPVARDTIARHLQNQPDWSELPILILLDQAAPHALMHATLAELWPRSRQIFYERPVAALELVSGIQSALLTRMRQRDVRDHIEREIELRRELNHRVKNMLASVTSIFEMTKRQAETLEQLSSDFGGRLQSLANVHSAVFRAGGESVAIREIVGVTFAPYRMAGRDRILVRGPALTIRKEAGTTLALCLHELVTNAIKYGALSNNDGQVRCRWSVSKSGLFTLKWIERGGPPVRPPERRGYGTGYIRAALASLVGTAPVIRYRKSGLTCCATGPVSRILADHQKESCV